MDCGKCPSTDMASCDSCLGGCREESEFSLNDLLPAVVAILERAAERHGAPLKLVIDTRGPQYAYTAYGSECRQFDVTEIEKIGR